MRRKYDWAAIQAFYDEGHTVRECMAEFGFANGAWDAAVGRGEVIPRQEKNPRFRHDTRNAVRDSLEAGMSHEWRGSPLKVTLHHVNGDPYDNRLENLQFLCPNCHSQTPNFGGRNGHLRPRANGL